LKNGDIGLVQSLDPDCYSTLANPDYRPRRGEVVDLELVCTAYNGDTGYGGASAPWPHSPPDSAYVDAKAVASGQTSRTIATTVLPMLG
jgi:hypothetical protein